MCGDTFENPGIWQNIGNNLHDQGQNEISVRHIRGHQLWANSLLTIFVNKVLLEQLCPLIYVLPIFAFLLRWQT